MKTTTELKIDYAYLSWSYDFPSEIENALEGDYVAHAHLYDDETLKHVAIRLLIAPDASSKDVLDVVRRCQSHMHRTPNSDN